MSLRLPAQALRRFEAYVADMEAEDRKPMRQRDSRVYTAGYAVVETYGLLLGVSDPSDTDLVRSALQAVATEEA